MAIVPFLPTTLQDTEQHHNATWSDHMHLILSCNPRPDRRHGDDDAGWSGKTTSKLVLGGRSLRFANWLLVNQAYTKGRLQEADTHLALVFARCYTWHSLSISGLLPLGYRMQFCMPVQSLIVRHYIPASRPGNIGVFPRLLSGSPSKAFAERHVHSRLKRTEAGAFNDNSTDHGR